ncbi:GNAT family N-acetyltransferase [Desulfopila aestuarii]|uniref:Phosphinothricin acetyltransferase n=1 Tax=Desulfopila aestuarii DSM 18488 TaxID=1121416 RepID=A0A1M7Y8J6_9BACT|nr:GNAT family N-acetyltransferase [Desulfopila aestuarii]SHO48965.1 phosphinothricin acetyltransferase [Desulfopila aestuarii DSM 18488]
MEKAYHITKMTRADREQVMAIFNYYIEHSFAAYLEEPLPLEAYDRMLEAAAGYPTGLLRDATNTVLGFGMLRPHKPIPTFRHTAEVMYFLHSEYRERGLGKMMLQYLESEGHKQGITTLLAHISSRNPQSLQFHARNGFRQCGRFEAVGRKNNESFDTVWMQKML